MIVEIRYYLLYLMTRNKYIYIHTYTSYMVSGQIPAGQIPPGQIPPGQIPAGQIPPGHIPTTQ